MLGEIDPPMLGPLVLDALDQIRYWMLMVGSGGLGGVVGGFVTMVLTVGLGSGGWSDRKFKHVFYTGSVVGEVLALAIYSAMIGVNR